MSLETHKNNIDYIYSPRIFDAFHYFVLNILLRKKIYDYTSEYVM